MGEPALELCISKTSLGLKRSKHQVKAGGAPPESLFCNVTLCEYGSCLMVFAALLLLLECWELSFWMS